MERWPLVPCPEGVSTEAGERLSDKDTLKRCLSSPRYHLKTLRTCAFYRIPAYTTRFVGPVSSSFSTTKWMPLSGYLTISELPVSLPLT